MTARRSAAHDLDTPRGGRTNFFIPWMRIERSFASMCVAGGGWEGAVSGSRANLSRPARRIPLRSAVGGEDNLADKACETLPNWVQAGARGRPGSVQQFPRWMRISALHASPQLMYTPAAFRIDDLPTLHAFVRQHSFATLVTAAAEPFVTHLPLLLDADRGPHGTLVGHFARPNSHWQMDHVTQQSVAIFHGPHAYISPSWYRAGTTAVPTWNYAAVHAHGRLVILPDPQVTAILLQRMVETYEGPGPTAWTNQLPPEVNDKLINSVVAFEMPIERLEGKFKLGQNRVAADQIGAIEGLEMAGDEDSFRLAAFTRKQLGLATPK